MPSLENLKKITEELKVIGSKELKKEEVILKKETKTVRDDLSVLTQERLQLEKMLQEINNVQGEISQRIELIKTLEKRKKEIEKQLTSLGEETPIFLEEAKKKLNNLGKHIK